MNTLLPAALLAAAMFAPAAVSAADDAPALLARHAAYVGWHAGDGKVKTLRQVTEGVRDGKVRYTATTAWYGFATRESTTDQNGIESSDGFTGAVFWTSNENGFTVRPVGEVVQYLADLHGVFAELTTQLPGAVRGRETIDGVETTIVRLTPPGGAAPIDVFIEPNGAYRRIVIDPGGKYEATLNGLAYTEIEGRRFLTQWHFGSSRTVRRAVRTEVNAAVSPEDLRPPKQTATWTFGEAPAHVTLTRGNFPRIYVDALINGVKGKFIFDTGAGGTALTDSFARKAGAKRLGVSTIMGIGGGATANLYRLDAIAVGGSTLANVVARTGLVEEWFRDEGIDGLIGFDLLGGAVVDLNLDTGNLHVLDPAKVAPNRDSGIVLNVDLSELVMRVPMRLNDKIDVVATLDSGNPLNVLFSRDLITRDRLPFLVDPNTLGSTRSLSGVAGSEIERCGRLDQLALGPIVYKPVPACDSGSFARNEILVGLDFMKNFNYVFSYPDGIVVMQRRSGL